MHHRIPLIAVILGAAAATAAQDSSCPLVTSVAPFAATDLDRYTIDLSDGASTDRDGAADGGCTTEINLCIGGNEEAACPSAPATRLHMRVSGGGADARHAAEAALAEAVAKIPGVTALGRTIFQLAADGSS